MPDYNIYVRAVGTSNATLDNPTIPWAQRETTSPTIPWGQTQSGGSVGFNAGGVARTAAIFSNPDSIIGGAVSKVMKVLPAVAAAYAVYKTCEKIYETCLDFSTLKSGDYGTQIAFQNKRTSIDNIFKPVTTTVNAIRSKTQVEVENQRRSQTRELLGDSVINTYTNRGV